MKRLTMRSMTKSQNEGTGGRSNLRLDLRLDLKSDLK